MSANYDKTHAVRDLIAIIHACPTGAGADHPLCEARLGKNGPYYRFPSKLAAMSRLMKLMGWHAPAKVEIPPKDKFTLLLEETRSRSRREAGAATNAPASEAPCSAPKSTDAQTPAPSTETAPHASGHPPTSASNANGDSPGANALGYRKDDAIRDLAAMIQASPSAAGPDHPLCEMRMTTWGSYCRFPSKLGALLLLIRMQGWEQPVQVQFDPEGTAKFKALADCIRARR